MDRSVQISMKKENRGGPREGAGRPRFEPDEQKRRNISLSDRYMEMARKLGNGNATAGIRKALEMASREG